MEKPGYAESFRDLIVYKKARQLSRDVYRITLTFPEHEMRSLTDQLRRSSRSIGAQIAESWAKRQYEKHFITKLTDADGEQYETQHWMGVAFDCGYINPDEAATVQKLCQEIGRMLGSMIEKAPAFCANHPHAVREFEAKYILADKEE